MPVVFTPPDVLTDDVAHLHLSHPVTQRLLSRLLAQGFSARDLSRVTALHADVPRPAVLALGRLSLFGASAARLHDELLALAAWWDEDRHGAKLRPLPDKDTATLRSALESCLHERAPRLLPAAISKTLTAAAPADFAALWPALREEAEAEEDRAGKMLSARALAESQAMRALLASQDKAITAELTARQQLPCRSTRTRASAPPTRPTPAP
ncbi:MAG: hypothetical protein IPI49_02640 [Myxococcales bacterium]|nr:hypothetical protein [Myxococcales bacterium]